MAVSLQAGRPRRVGAPRYEKKRRQKYGEVRGAREGSLQISGHKTRSVFDRYNIVSESDLAKAAQALDAYHGNMGIVSDIVGAAEQILEKAQDGK